MTRLFHSSRLLIPEKKERNACRYCQLMCSACEREPGDAEGTSALNAPLTAGASQLIRPVNDLSARKG